MTTSYIDIVFDGPPGPQCGRFVEVENDRGHSISVGEWIQRADGYWALRLTKWSPLPNGLTMAEAEMLTLTAEESGELVQACTKILRHGKDIHLTKEGCDAKDHLLEEAGDVLACLAILCHNGLIDREQLNRASQAKLAKLHDPDKRKVYHLTPEMIP